MPAYFDEGNQAAAGDNEMRSLQKIVSSLNSAGGSSITGQYSGVGPPEGVVTAPVGSHYLDTLNLQGYDKYSGSGNTGWL